VKIVTVSEGEVGDLHIGLKGAMNALYLKDLADKTRRENLSPRAMTLTPRPRSGLWWGSRLDGGCSSTMRGR